MPTKKDLASEFLHDIESRGERLDYVPESQHIVLRGSQEEKRVPLWRLDVMVFNFLVAHAALSSVTVAEVLDEVLSMIM